MPDVLIFSPHQNLLPEIAAAIPDGLSSRSWSDLDEFRDALREAAQRARPPVVVVVVPDTSPQPGSVPTLRCLGSDLTRFPLILVPVGDHVSLPWFSTLIACRPRAWVSYPFAAAELRAILAETVEVASWQASGEDLEVMLAETNRRLNARLQELNTIYTIGKSVTSSLNVEEILDRVVTISINLTGAEEGLIILQEAGKLSLRISRSREAEASDHLHMEATDDVARQVLRSGRPAMLRREVRVGDGRLAQALLYVPLRAPDTGIMGVLGVIQRTRPVAFTEYQLFALSTVADFAAIALENAQLYARGQAERSRLSAILENVVEAIIVTDEENRLWLWSDTAARLFDISPEDRGQPLEECVANADVRTLFDRARGDARVLHSEITVGGDRVYNAQLSTISGAVRVAVMQEITHLKELDRLKSEFVSTVSHDLRTPLTTIQGYIDLLDRVGPLNEMQRSFIDKALTSLDHITSLISNLLDIGRIEAGYDLEMKPLRVGELVQAAAEAAAVSARDAGIEISVTVSDAPLWVRGDARRLRQVFDNLIDNAVKYNWPGGRVWVSARRDADHIVVRVRDSGIGIPAAEQAKIFDRFYRIQSPETEAIHGTGLGLAIVRSVAEKHKGRVWVESAAGKGSTFTFVLPAYEPVD